MLIEPFEPSWKRETLKIRRTVNVITQIHDEFLDSSGNVIKELRFEKRSLQPPVFVIPGWVARSNSVTNANFVSLPSHSCGGEEVILSDSDNASSSTHYHTPEAPPLFVPEAIEVSSSPDKSSSRMADTEILENINKSLDVKNFSFWDCPSLRNKYKTSQSIYMPVYVYGNAEESDKVKIIVNPQTGSRDEARLVDLIHINELQKYQSVQYWEEQRIGDCYPNIRGISDRGSHMVAFVDFAIEESNEFLDMHLSVIDKQKLKKVSFWNCALPSTAKVLPPPRRGGTTISVEDNSNKCRGDLPQDILAKKRNKPYQSYGQTGTSQMQKILLDLADEDDDISSSKRSRRDSEELVRRRSCVVADVPSSSIDNSQGARPSGESSNNSELQQLLVNLSHVSPCSKLFSEFVFSKICDDNLLDMSQLDRLVTSSDGLFVSTLDNLRGNTGRKHSCVLADKFYRKIGYAEAIAAGIPVVHFSWIVDCLTLKRVVPFDRRSHLVKSVSMLGFDNFQPYTAKSIDRRRPLSGLLIAISAESPEFFSKLSFLANNLGASVRTVSFSVTDEELAKQVERADYVLCSTYNKSKISRLEAVAENVPRVTIHWLIDCVCLCQRVNHTSNVGYFRYKAT